MDNKDKEFHHHHHDHNTFNNNNFQYKLITLATRNNITTTIRCIQVKKPIPTKHDSDYLTILKKDYQKLYRHAYTLTIVRKFSK